MRRRSPATSPRRAVYYGICRATFYKWSRRYEEQGLRDRSSRPFSSPRATSVEVIGKIIYLRQSYYFGPHKIAMHLKRYHEITISPSGVWRVLRRVDLNRLPSSQRHKRHEQRWKRYEKPQPGHRVQGDVKFITPVGGAGRKFYQFAALGRPQWCWTACWLLGSDSREGQHEALGLTASCTRCASSAASAEFVPSRCVRPGVASDADAKWCGPNNEHVFNRLELRRRAVSGPNPTACRMRNRRTRAYPATGKHLEVQGISTYRIANSQITDEWASPDIMGTMQRLGVAPAPGAVD